MPFIVIQGTFHVKGYSPDGDSLKFKAKNKRMWDKLDGIPTKRNIWGHVQLRFEGIDALETHFGRSHQPKTWGDQATDFLLEQAGITKVQWSPNREKVTKANDAVPGYIVSRTTERYGRPVCFVFTGEAPEEDGSSIHFDEERLCQSLNYKLIAAGLVYPLYYKGLFFDLRSTMTAALQQARQDKKGLWPEDKTGGLHYQERGDITERHPIFPKLFRRLMTHVDAGGSLSNFKEYLEKRREGVMIISRQHFTHLDNVVEVEGEELRLAYPPEDLVFLD